MSEKARFQISEEIMAKVAGGEDTEILLQYAQRHKELRETQLAEAIKELERQKAQRESA